jgi:hypothetical protein
VAGLREKTLGIVSTVYNTLQMKTIVSMFLYNLAISSVVGCNLDQLP